MTSRLTLAVAVLLAAAPLYADDAQDAAVKAVEKLGGSVTRDDQDTAHPVVAVDLGTAPVTDRGLKDVAPLKGLKTLNLALCLGVTDKGLKDVAGLTGLRTLNLSYTRTTDDGLKLLTSLTGLKELNLIGTKMTDAGVAELQKALPDCKISR